MIGWQSRTDGLRCSQRQCPGWLQEGDEQREWLSIRARHGTREEGIRPRKGSGKAADAKSRTRTEQAQMASPRGVPRPIPVFPPTLVAEGVNVDGVARVGALQGAVANAAVQGRVAGLADAGVGDSVSAIASNHIVGVAQDHVEGVCREGGRGGCRRGRFGGSAEEQVVAFWCPRQAGWTGRQRKLQGEVWGKRVRGDVGVQPPAAGCPPSRAAVLLSLLLPHSLAGQGALIREAASMRAPPAQ